MSDHTQQHVHVVVLPSGKRIEVRYFERHSEHDGDCASADLHVCGTCGSELVYPVDWEEAGPTHWRVVLRCPNCEWTGTGVFEQDFVERFDEELDRGSEVLVRDLKMLAQSNMEDEIERFVIALDGGHIVPEDF